jgi:hypothetical protein
VLRPFEVARGMEQGGGGGYGAGGGPPPPHGACCVTAERGSGERAKLREMAEVARGVGLWGTAPAV